MQFAARRPSWQLCFAAECENVDNTAARNVGSKSQARFAVIQAPVCAEQVNAGRLSGVAELDAGGFEKRVGGISSMIMLMEAEKQQHKQGSSQTHVALLPNVHNRQGACQQQQHAQLKVQHIQAAAARPAGASKVRLS